MEWLANLVVWTLTWTCIIAKLERGSRQPLNERHPIIFTHVLMNRGESLMDYKPVESWDDFIDKDLLSWNPAALERLTNEGIRNQYEIGKYLRVRYNSLLHERYWKPDIYVLSADADSYISSAMAVMAGMFPPTDSQDVWNPSLKWQPTPVHVVTEYADNKLLMRMKCPAEEELEVESRNNFPEFSKIRRKIDSILQFLTYSVGAKVQDKHVPSIVNLLSTQEKYNLSHPFWAQMVYPNPIRKVRKKLFSPPVFNEGNKKFKSGPLLTEMLSHIDAKISGQLKPDRTMWMYSGGDSFICYLVSTLKLNLTLPPTFSDMILLELRHDSSYPGLYYVMLLYKGKNDEEAINLKMENCSILCPLNEFKNIIQPYLVTDWKTDCKITSSAIQNLSFIELIGVFCIALIKLWSSY